MRNLIQPLPAMRCTRCDGELLFKCVERGNPVLDIEVQVFVCAKCGREHSRQLTHDRYTAHTAPDGNGVRFATLAPRLVRASFFHEA